ncbi:MAG: tRNA uridine-5-carboxymethylaminomethyl(34) synthesis GTPase MnmE [Vicinamibacterales bacterium]
MPFSTADTIVAIATPPGRSGLGVIRLSGSHAGDIARSLVARTTPFTPRHATFCRLSEAALVMPDVVASDRVVVTFFPGPHSYTGENVAEISAHGSPVILSAIVRRSMTAGARLAEPGEFTLRAFLNGKIDLIQAEAVADLIDAVTPMQARAAFDQLEGSLTSAIRAIEEDLFDLTAKLEASLDFPEEGYHFLGRGEARVVLERVIGRIDALLAQATTGRLLREGAQVAIVGAPNVGKSSLFNTLLNVERAIVTDIPGTTRDMLTERANIGGLSLALVDTAGVRESSDAIERAGVARALDAVGVADLVLVVLDRSRPLSQDDRDVLRVTAGRRRLVVVNKRDLAAAWSAESLALDDEVVLFSALTRDGLAELLAAATRALTSGEALRDRPEITNVRHTSLLERARTALDGARRAIAEAVPEEFPLIDLQEATNALQEITGRRTTDDLLERIFERFCIGK